MSRKAIVSCLIHLRHVPCQQLFWKPIIDMKKTYGKKQSGKGLEFFENFKTPWAFKG